MSLPINHALKPVSDAIERATMPLAKELEAVRKRLSVFLLDNSYSARFIAGQLAKGYQNNSEGLLEFGDEMPFMQTHSAPESPADIVERELHSMRLLPIFLLDMAGLLDKQPTNKVFNNRHKRKLEDYRRDLQVTRQRMISANTGLVGFAAQKYNTHLSFDDLMQEGILGLIKAVDRFDPERGISFSTYAMYWIKQAISRLIVKQEKIVRLPLPLAEKSAVVFEAMRSCYLQTERWPSCAELQKLCDLSERDIETISSYYQATHALDAVFHRDDDSQLLLEQIAQQQFDLPLDELIAKGLADFLIEALASLPEKQSSILAMRFGLYNQDEMTLQAVADQLHVTRERVRQIQNEALKKLKQQFGCDLLPFLDASDDRR